MKFLRCCWHIDPSSFFISPKPLQLLSFLNNSWFQLDLSLYKLNFILAKQFIARDEANGRWTRRARTIKFSPKIGLETNDDRAIDLSCRACGAGAWALGLDSRLGTPASLPFSTPNLQLILRVVAELGILRVVAELQNSWDVKSTPKSLKFL